MRFINHGFDGWAGGARRRDRLWDTLFALYWKWLLWLFYRNYKIHKKMHIWRPKYSRNYGVHCLDRVPQSSGTSTIVKRNYAN
jgi:hypothetical protein